MNARSVVPQPSPALTPAAGSRRPHQIDRPRYEAGRRGLRQRRNPGESAEIARRSLPHVSWPVLARPPTTCRRLYQKVLDEAVIPGRRLCGSCQPHASGAVAKHARQSRITFGKQDSNTGSAKNHEGSRRTRKRFARSDHDHSSPTNRCGQSKDDPTAFLRGPSWFFAFSVLSPCLLAKPTTPRTPEVIQDRVRAIAMGALTPQPRTARGTPP